MKAYELKSGHNLARIGKGVLSLLAVVALAVSAAAQLTDRTGSRSGYLWPCRLEDRICPDHDCVIPLDGGRQSGRLSPTVAEEAVAVAVSRRTRLVKYSSR
jgi:hypothetical protein